MVIHAQSLCNKSFDSFMVPHILNIRMLWMHRVEKLKILTELAIWVGVFQNCTKKCTTCTFYRRLDTCLECQFSFLDA